MATTVIYDYEVLLSPQIAIPCFIILVLVLSYIANKFVQLAVISKIRKTKNRWDDLFADAFGKMIPYSFFGLGLHIIFSGLNSINDSILYIIDKVIIIILVLLLMISTAKFFILFFQKWGDSHEQARPLVQPAQLLSKVIFGIIGILIVMDSLNISITPLITTLGIGSVAVALALQDTLAQFFAGIYIMIDRPVRVGDYIKLDNGDEGYVEMIGFRSTRIRTLPNNTIIIPNGKLAQSIIMNYYMPEKKLSAKVSVGVSYNCDPEVVEKILFEETLKIRDRMEGMSKDFDPVVRFSSFGDSALEFTIFFRIEEFVNQFAICHELRKSIFKRFKEENIDIPFPQRVVWLNDMRKSE